MSLEPGALYHLTDEATWQTANASGQLLAASLETEGFIHCSWGRQVPGTLAKHFAGVTGILAVELDPAAVREWLVEEDTSGSGQTFPHVYGPIPLSAVLGSQAVSADA